MLCHYNKPVVNNICSPFKDVIDSLQSKLGFLSTAHFALVVENIKGLRSNKLSLLNPKERVAVVSRRN